jgi:hypothetical protein
MLFTRGLKPGSLEGKSSGFADMKNTVQLGLWCGWLSLALLAGGCRTSNYYCVTDSANGKSYFTPRVSKDRKTGAVTFVDVVSGQELKLLKPQVKSVGRQAFNDAVLKK